MANNNHKASVRPLLLFFAGAYAISWTIWFPLYAPALGISGLPILPYHHALGGVGPLLAALILTYVYSGKKGINRLVKQSFKVRPLIYFFVALLMPFILAVIAAVLRHVTAGIPINLSGLGHFSEFPEFTFASIFLYNLIFFGFGEEVGWRGFVLPRLQQQLRPIAATGILTLFWALWHWPLFLYRSGYMGMDVTGVFGWLFSLLTGGLLLTWLYNSSRGSVLACAVFHATVDMVFTADWQDQGIINYLGILITIWGLVSMIFLSSKKIKPLDSKRLLNSVEKEKLIL